MRFLCSLVLSMLIFFTPVVSKAVEIVNTQPTRSALSTAPGVDFDWTLKSGTDAQWLASKFSLDKDYFLTDLHGWLYNDGSDTGDNFSITIYGDGGEVPDTANLLYSNGGSISGIDGQYNWEGFQIAAGSWGPGLELSLGDYWIAFELRTSNYANPYAGTMADGAALPLTDGAFDVGSGWTAYDDLSLGVRIQGVEAAPVPEPSTFLLLGAGLGGLALYRRKAKK